MDRDNPQAVVGRLLNYLDANPMIGTFNLDQKHIKFMQVVGGVRSDGFFQIAAVCNCRCQGVCECEHDLVYSVNANADMANDTHRGGVSFSQRDNVGREMPSRAASCSWCIPNLARASDKHGPVNTTPI